MIHPDVIQHKDILAFLKKNLVRKVWKFIAKLYYQSVIFRLSPICWYQQAVFNLWPPGVPSTYVVGCYWNVGYMAPTYLQLPLLQLGANNVYLLVFSSWKVNITKNPIAVMGLQIRLGMFWASDACWKFTIFPIQN